MKSEMAKMQQAATAPKDQTKPKSNEQTKQKSNEQIQSSPNPKQAQKQNIDIQPKLMSISPQPIIPNIEHCHSEGMKIIHSEVFGTSAVAYNPIIESGIVRFEGIFEKSLTNLYIGIADSSVVFEADQAPQDGQYVDKTVTYASCGDIRHFQEDNKIGGNNRYNDNQKVALEVNMDSTPRTLHFFVEGKEQPLSIINIPSSIRFFISTLHENATFTLTQFKSLSSSSAKGVEGSKKLDWGKESDWK
ncbi:MAG: hypothetical protein EZS28_013803 [Streblomastix strix]|uniref:B30.2/SPRY domain-containing protein n=1 Tax=Streblomastix strix TaxID=222440 RepID=A0A5J4W8F2_9EUKA|nr:MAG: hypothetical protein EZS28_013803 [Streblomastix strix]